VLVGVGGLLVGVDGLFTIIDFDKDQILVEFWLNMGSVISVT